MSERRKMKKKCTKCGETKLLEEFHKNETTKDGRINKCRQCSNESYRNREYELTCQNPDCGKEFIHCFKRKFCHECSPTRMTQEGVAEGNKRCSKCGTEKKLSEFYTRKGSPDGREGRCKNCINNSRKKYSLKCQKPGCDIVFTDVNKSNKFCWSCRKTRWDFDKCLAAAKKYNSRSVFATGSPGAYGMAKRKGWLNEIASHMTWLNGITRTDQELQEEMRKYSSRGEFYNKNCSFYAQAKKRDWYSDFAQEIYGDPIKFGYLRSDFVKACERGSGKGTLYLIKCWNKDEIFYKIGITSRSVEDRYRQSGDSPSRELPYFYTVIWIIQGPPMEIWDMEKEYIRNTSKIRYQPELWPTYSLETFKCHGNCKILRKPEII